MAAKDGKQGGTARRDLLQQIENEVQQKWEENKVFECDAPDEASEKYLATFPYPYMNGLLHIGHAFSLTKAIFAAQFHRLLGKKVLFPFGFHCTGMPIQAAANKLARELSVYGEPFPIFPAGIPQPVETADGTIVLTDDGVQLQWKYPASTNKKAIKQYHVMMKVKGAEFKKVATVPHPSAEELAANGKKVRAVVQVEGGGYIYKVQAELEDGSMCPEGKESDEVSVDAAPKDKKGGAAPGGKRVAKKIVAKTGDAALQWEILKAMDLSDEHIPKFKESLYWLEYFPPLGVRDLKSFGTPVDFRRSFMTTSVNPYYDSFVRWQFRKLKAADKIGFGKRPTIFSEVDGQACMDHDRAEGEGVGPQEYTAIKVELLELTEAMSKAFGKSKVFLLAATLRPETMIGQTNCWILPEGQYGCYKAPNNEIFVTSQRAARNMSFQDILMPWGKPECVLQVTGQELMGKKVKAPTSPYEFVHILPLTTIKMDKGTGIVTSVPSDSPDDYAAIMDLMKPGKQAHFGLRKEWIEPFELIPVIDVEIDGEVRTMAAQYVCEKLGVQSINDRVKLAEAHDTCYKLGFDKGVMSAGPFKGVPVKKAKFDFRAVMIKDKQAFIYSEPEKKVISRSNDECVVASIDQWYLKYGEETWRKQIEDHLHSKNFTSYNDRIEESFEDAIGWLKEWACSRSFGLGTKVPWDEQFVVESLSDSTIYMAYYTVAHLLQGGEGNLDGSGKSPAGIKAEDLDDEIWDFIFLNGPLPKNSKVAQKTLEKARKEFRFWYPVDLRVSGKDLIQNHLTMALYNHACVWEKEPEMWPRSIFCNGWLLVNNEKMSKSKGNFFTLQEIIGKYSSDATRLAMANSGDTLEPANFDETVCNKAILNLAVFLDTMKAFLDNNEPVEGGKEDARFVDKWFANEMNRLVQESKKFYETMYYREALRTAYFEFTSVFDQYRDICKAANAKPNKLLVMRYFEWQMIVLSPICPHFCEHGWTLLGKKGTVLDARYPEPLKPVDTSIAKQGDYMYSKVPHEFIKLLEKATKSGTAKSGVIYVAKDFSEWKKSVLTLLRKKHSEGKLPLTAQEEMKSNPEAAAQWKDIMADLMADASLKPFGKHVGPFAAFKRDEAASFGASALDASVPFDETALLNENVQYLIKKLQVEFTVRSADDPAGPEQKDAAANAQPGKPAVHFVVEGGKPAAKPAAKAAAAGKAGGGKPAANVATISDMKKLNEHLSTRSYFEGGSKPTQGDIAQLAVTPGNVSAEQFPHVARWFKHISSFKPAQREAW